MLRVIWTRGLDWMRYDFVSNMICGTAKYFVGDVVARNETEVSCGRMV